MVTQQNGRLLLRVYGDSLSLPRAKESIEYTQTYTEILRSQLQHEGLCVDLYNRSIGGVTIAELTKLLQNDQTYFGREPQILVIQCGIVDCSPRPINGRMRRLVGRLPRPLRNRVISFLHTNRARMLNSGLKWRMTEPAAFQAAYRMLLETAAGSGGRVFTVNIAPTTPEMEAHSPGLSGSIELYNGFIAEAVRDAGPNVALVDVNQAISRDPNGVRRYINANDGHHITHEGHLLYSRLIMAAAEQHICPSSGRGKPRFECFVAR